MTDLDRDLRAVLDRQAERATWSPTSAADVAGRAGRVRRRGRMGAVVGAAVLVAAVAIPVSVLRDSAPDTAPAVGVDPSSAPPRIGYAVDGLYRYPDGRSVLIPGDTTSSAIVSDGLLVTSRPPGDAQPQRLELVQPDGSARDVLDAGDTVTGPPVVSTRGSWAAVAVGADGRTRLIVDGVDGSRTSRTVDAGTRVLGIDDQDTTVTYLDPKGYWRIAAGETTRTVSPQQLPLSANTRPDDFSAASGLFSLRGFTAGGANPRTPVVVDTAGRFVWGQLPDDNSARFSPDGSMLIQFRRDQGRALELRDARTGERQASIAGANSTGSRTELRDVVWEDDTHLLATRSIGDGRRALVRIALDGTSTPLDVPTIAEDADLVWDTRP